MASAGNHNTKPNRNLDGVEENNQVPEWVLAKQGIRLLLNNNAKDADELFLSYPESLVIFSGYSFATFMDALMTFEDDKLNTSTTILKEVERRCTTNTGWLSSMRLKVFGSSSEIHYTLAQSLESQIILADSQVCLAILTFLQQDISGYLKGGWILRKAWKVYQSVYNDIRTLYMEKGGDVNLPDVQACTSHTSLSSPENSGSSRPTTSKKDLSGFDDEQDKSGFIPKHPPVNGYCTKKSKIASSHSAIFPNPRTLKNSIDDTNTDCSSGNSSPNSSKNNCSRSSISGPSATGFSSLKKSMSVNSALSKNKKKSSTSDYWSSKISPFTSSLSLSYITTLNIFSPSEKLRSNEIDRDTIERLMGAVSFGYGVFQLGVSLLPPSLLKLTNFLGFGGNRQNGIACLMYARQGVDMRAPLATLTLLWYHTIVRPFYALDGSNVRAGAEAATQLLQETDKEYSQSALFLFFKGRVNRLNSDIPAALGCFQSVVDHAAQREIKILALHEVGWCHLIQLQYGSAESTFIYLKSFSRWSRSFYTYLSGICTGSCENPRNYDNLKHLKNDISTKDKGNQLDLFLTRRAKCCPDDEEQLSKLNPVFWRLLVYEMLYLWNAMPSCNTETIEKARKDCQSLTKTDWTNEPMIGLSKFLLGCCYCAQSKYSTAITNFRMCLDLRKNLPYNSDDAHVSAFCTYELCCLLSKETETKDEAKELLQHISYYKDYDFEHRLNVRVHLMLKQISNT